MSYCENYPTHELGPIAKVLNINRGNRMVSLTSTASCAKGLNDYLKREKGEDYGISNLQNFSEKDIYYPIPYDEWKLDPEGMYQNPGY